MVWVDRRDRGWAQHLIYPAAARAPLITWVPVLGCPLRQAEVAQLARANTIDHPTSPGMAGLALRMDQPVQLLQQVVLLVVLVVEAGTRRLFAALSTGR